MHFYIIVQETRNMIFINNEKEKLKTKRTCRVDAHQSCKKNIFNNNIVNHISPTESQPFHNLFRLTAKVCRCTLVRVIGNILLNFFYQNCKFSTFKNQHVKLSFLVEIISIVAATPPSTLYIIVSRQLYQIRANNTDRATLTKEMTRF